MLFFKTQRGQVVLNFIFAFFAAVVILGALFKIRHWPFADEMITLGLLSEVIVFLVMAFMAVGGIAFFQGQFGLAAFAGTLVGAILAFLWFNVHPARFFMGDTGAMSLGMTLAVLAFLTNTVFILPIIGFVFVIEALSTIIQIFSKKVFKRKVFLSSPIHHHLEAIGWPETRIVERAWIIGAVLAVAGLVLGLIGRG